MKIPDAKTAVDKECENLEKVLAWHPTKVRNKKEVIAEARNEGKTVHFASLVDLCHLKSVSHSFKNTQDESYSEVTL